MLIIKSLNKLDEEIINEIIEFNNRMLVTIKIKIINYSIF